MLIAGFGRLVGLDIGVLLNNQTGSKVCSQVGGNDIEWLLVNSLDGSIRNSSSFQSEKDQACRVTGEISWPAGGVAETAWLAG